MRKVLVLLSVFIFFNSCAFAIQSQESLNTNSLKVYSQDGKFGIKDNSGKILLEAKYKKLIRLGETSWIVQNYNRFGVIDSYGNYLVQPKYRHVERIFGKYVKLGNTKDYGLYDEYGVAIIPPEYMDISPMFGGIFLTYKNYKYGITSITGEVLMDNKYDYIYMPKPNLIRVKTEVQWYEIERVSKGTFDIPEGSIKFSEKGDDFVISKWVINTGVGAGYSVVTATDYILKIFSSISPSYEDTIDELMYSQGADAVSIIMKMGWLPKFPFVYTKNYIENIKTPNQSPLANVRNDLKNQMK